jgi:hypothetical protein
LVHVLGRVGVAVEDGVDGVGVGALAELDALALGVLVGG